MFEITRRSAIRNLAVLAAGATLPAAAAPRQTSASGCVPLVHITDLYHPPQDPDDHLDLATIAGLPEYELRGVVLDATRKFLVGKPDGWDVPRDPGFVPVAQLGYLTGRTIPAAMGPVEPLISPGDTASDRPRAEQAGIHLLLEVLARSSEPVTISVVGSCRVLAAAFNREPELLKARTLTVLLNAGSTGGTKQEWNAGLDPAAYIAVWRSGLPIEWYPPATDSGAFNRVHERGTHWQAEHAVLFRELPDRLRAWFCYAFNGEERGDIIRALEETGRGPAWEKVLAGKRNLWATVSLVMSAGRALARTPEGWRFVPGAAAAELETWPLRLDPIKAAVDDDARVSWQQVDEPSSVRLFGRKPGADYGVAMAEALNALLRGVAL